MATRYVVEWLEGETTITQGFAFQPGAFEFWARLVASEADGGSDIKCAAIRYMGPNGERAPDPFIQGK
jgi:hypothetical protein